MAKRQRQQQEIARKRLREEKEKEQKEKGANQRNLYQEYISRNQDDYAYPLYPTTNQSYESETEMPQNNVNIEQPQNNVNIEQPQNNYNRLTRAFNYASPYISSAAQSGIHGLKTAATFVKNASDRSLYNQGYLDEDYNILPTGQRQRIPTRVTKNNLHLDDSDSEEDINPFGRGRKTRTKRATKNKSSKKRTTKKTKQNKNKPKQHKLKKSKKIHR